MAAKSNMTPQDYITGKENAKGGRINRRLWAEEKVRKYQKEADDLAYEIRKDDDTLKLLADLAEDHKLRQYDMQLAKRASMDAETEEDKDLAFEDYVRAQEAIKAIEVKMRLAYYGR